MKPSNVAPLPTPDFPAAHSMDTTWFAVDDDGAIAAFSTGEDGAVPFAYSGEQGDEGLLFAPFAARGALLELDAGERSFAPLSTEEPQLLLFTSAPRAGLPSGAKRVGLRRIVYHASRLSEDEVARLSAMKNFEGALPFDLDLATDAIADAMYGFDGGGEYGVFTYNTDFGEEGLYSVLRVATEPLLRAEELSQELSDIVTEFRFEGVTFANSTDLHLRDHGGGVGWGYEIAPDGTITREYDTRATQASPARLRWVVIVLFVAILALLTFLMTR